MRNGNSAVGTAAALGPEPEDEGSQEKVEGSQGSVVAKEEREDAMKEERKRELSTSAKSTTGLAWAPQLDLLMEMCFDVGA